MIHWAGEASKPYRRFGFGAAALFLLALVVYWPALHGQFVWDDALLVTKNPLATGELSFRSVWFQTDFPLALTVLWLQSLAWGNNASGYHVVNVLLHGTSAVILWRVLAKLKIPGAFLIAMVFTVHPVCVGSVAWISEIKNTLSLPFYLLSIWWYLGFEEERGIGDTPRPQRPRLLYALSLAAFVLALLSKTSTVMLPVVLLGCAWWQRGFVTKRDWVQCAPYFIMALAFGLMTVWFQTHQTIRGLTVQTESFWGRLAGAGMAIWFYLGKAILPVKLSMIYPLWKIDERSPLSYLPLLLLAGAFALCWWFRRGWGRPVLFGLGYFVITLFPALGFFDMYFLSFSRVSDHFEYLSIIGVIALAIAGLCSVLKGMGWRLASATLVAALSVLAWQRAQVLANDETLWRDTLAKNPAAWCAHNNLGCILAEQKQYDAAITHFLASLETNPINAPAHFNLAKALVVQGRFSEAETHFRAALKIKSGSDTRLEFARLLQQTGKIHEAVTQYRQVLSLKTNSTEALNNLAWLLASAPDASVRNGAEAVRIAEQACQITNHKEAVPMGTLAAAYAEAGRFTEAVATAEKAIQLATASGNTQFAVINGQLLRYYRAGKAWHQPASQPAGKN